MLFGSKDIRAHLPKSGQMPSGCIRSLAMPQYYRIKNHVNAEMLLSLCNEHLEYRIIPPHFHSLSLGKPDRHNFPVIFLKEARAKSFCGLIAPTLVLAELVQPALVLGGDLASF